MKIAQVVCVFPPYQSGIGNAAYHFARLAAGYKHDVTVFTPAYRADNTEFTGFRTDRLKPLLALGNGAFMPGLFFKLRSFDVVHLHYPFYGGAEIIWLAKKFKLKFKLIIHYHMDTLSLRPFANVLSLPGLMIQKNLFDSASIITAASLDYIRNSVISPYFQVNREKFEEIPFGVEAEKFSPVQPGICRGKVLFVGALDKAHDFKGLEILMAAMGGLERSIRLIIVGDGDLRGYYERMALNYGLRERIDFAGRVADNALPDYYRQAAVTVLPSLNSHEAFGLVLLESMACGTPVIASDLPGVRRVFLPGREGLLVKAGDSEGLRSKINDLLADNKRRENMGRAGRLLVLEKYDWRQVGEKINKLYQKAASL